MNRWTHRRQPLTRPSCMTAEYWRSAEARNCSNPLIFRSSGSIWVLPAEGVLSAESRVGAAEKPERPAVRVPVGVNDFTNENDMVAADIGVSDLALEYRKDAGQDGTAGPADFIIDSFPFVDRLPRKAGRQFLLAFAKNVHRKIFAGKINAHAVGMASEAPEYQRRVERDRVEGVCRIADQLAAMIAGGDDRHAGQKRAKRAAKPLLINCGRHGSSHPSLIRHTITRQFGPFG